MTTALDPIQLRDHQLANRIAMSPMTRSRAYGPGATVTDLTATYYAQRASAGLIVTEGTQPSVIGQGYPNTPGLHSAEQVTAWRQVTDAVHGSRPHDLRPTDAHRPHRASRPAARRVDPRRPVRGRREGSRVHPGGPARVRQAEGVEP
jgi:hypothetical protein